jgi:prepilin-type N-terminal cleavage/methylation domain-containing protein
MRVRHGFTVAELLVATAIGGIATALMTMTVVRQQRFFSSASEVLSVRSQLRDAADVLATDLRSASVGELGLPVMMDTAVEMYSVIASSIACTISSATTIGLPPATLAQGNTLTSILALPDTGDLSAIYSADSARWDYHRIASFGSSVIATSCPSSSGFTKPGDAAAGYQLTVATAPATPITKGAIVHFLRRARYSFYRSSDNDWYLGYRRCGVSPPYACSSIQPVSGPYKPYRSDGSGGISLRYLDASGAILTNAAQSKSVTRVDIVLRGQSQSTVSLTGDSRRIWRDSVIVSVSPRNQAQ